MSILLALAAFIARCLNALERFVMRQLSKPAGPLRLDDERGAR